MVGSKQSITLEQAGHVNTGILSYSVKYAVHSTARLEMQHLHRLLLVTAAVIKWIYAEVMMKRY